MKPVKHITATVIWEAHALNRDEGAGTNVQTIKKLTRRNGVYSFISKPAIRHYLWETLHKAYGWEPAPVSKPAKAQGSQGNVVQFNLEESCILTHEELDLFGYMYTGDITLTRKSPVGITKAVALEPWQGDIAFYANHDLVRRYQQSTGDAKLEPNPYNKEEHLSYYKCSFTIDMHRLGIDEWVIDKDGKALDILEKLMLSKSVEDGKIYINKEQGRILFVIKRDKLKERLENVLNAIVNGFYAQSSNELNTLIPIYGALAIVKLPVPILDKAVSSVQDLNNFSARVSQIESNFLSGDTEKNIYVFGANVQQQNGVPIGNIVDMLVVAWDEYVSDLVNGAEEIKSIEQIEKIKEEIKQEKEEKKNKNKKKK